MVIKKLFIFDFDGTLFRSPGPFKGYDKTIDEWYRDEISLSISMVPAQPGIDWFFPEIVTKAQEAWGDPESYSVLLTGRREDVEGFRQRITEILFAQKLHFDEFYLKPGEGKTVEFKSRKIFEIFHNLKRYCSELEEIHIFDDRHHHLPVFEKKLATSKVKVFTYPAGVWLKE